LAAAGLAAAFSTAPNDAQQGWGALRMRGRPRLGRRGGRINANTVAAVSVRRS
jgi:hypothetical protein